MNRPLRAMRFVFVAILLAALAACTREVDIGELRAEIGESPVVLLSTSTCGYCERLRADLDEWGVAYDDLDVESDRAGRNAYDEVNGRGVPILVIGDSVLHGYSPAETRSLLIAANLLPTP